MSLSCLGCGMDLDSCLYSVSHSNALSCCPDCHHSSDERPRSGYPSRNPVAPLVDQATGAGAHSSLAEVELCFTTGLQELHREIHEIRDPLVLLARLHRCEDELARVRRQLDAFAVVVNGLVLTVAQRAPQYDGRPVAEEGGL
jgi:hypothetical protein